MTAVLAPALRPTVDLGHCRFELLSGDELSAFRVQALAAANKAMQMLARIARRRMPDQPTFVEIAAEPTEQNWRTRLREALR